MTRRILGVFMVAIVFAMLFAGCAAKRESTSVADNMKADRDGGSTSFQLNGDAGYSEEKPMSEAAADQVKGETAITGSGTAAQSFSNAILAQRKIIQNANVSVEVESFDVAYGKLNSIVSAFGYVQESNITKDKVYVDSKIKLITRGVIVIRVDREKFSSILKDVKGLGTVMDERISTDDVTDKFFDVESRLKLLKYEESRLMEYLDRINDPETIFKTESRLTDIRHEIEGLTGTLKKWDDLVKLSTITINISEKNPEAVAVSEKKESYVERLLGNFLGSTKGMFTFLGELLIIFAQLLPLLILLSIVALVVVLIYKRTIANSAARTVGNKEENQSRM